MNFDQENNVWKLLKMSHLSFPILKSCKNAKIWIFAPKYDFFSSIIRCVDSSSTYSTIFCIVCKNVSHPNPSTHIKSKALTLISNLLDDWKLRDDSNIETRYSLNQSRNWPLTHRLYFDSWTNRITINCCFYY